MKFRANIQRHGKTATGIEVPPEVVEGLGSHKRPPVRVTLNDFTYRTTIAPMGGVFMIPLSADVRAASGAAASDEVDVGIEITLHTEPREGGIPEHFATELAMQLTAETFFADLSYSTKRQIVLEIEGAKTAGTRQRPIDSAIVKLKEGTI
jgi:hypothetical protein